MTWAGADRAVKKVTIRKRHTQLQHLRRRVEDSEDLRGLKAVIARNSNKPGIAWTQVKKGLGL